MAIEVRGARPEEIPAVLEMIPRVMGAPRQYFAAAYRNDPCRRPEHSRIVRVDGEIVSHIRLYDRWQRVGSVPVRVGCVGDVCTLPEHRKRGYCRALLEDALRYWDEHDYDLSMIVSGVGVYAACGWVPFLERRFEMPVGQPADTPRQVAGSATGMATPSAPVGRRLAPGSYEVRRFVRCEDLDAVAGVYAASNAERSLTTVRPPEYWARHFSWISGEVEEAFLVAERDTRIVAYLRCEGGGERLTISECCALPGHEPATLDLLAATLAFAMKRRVGALQGHLPADHPVLAAAAARPGFATSETQVLLFRLVNLQRLLERLRPLLEQRARAAGCEGELTLEVDGQAATLRVHAGRVEIEDGLNSTRRHEDTKGEHGEQIDRQTRSRPEASLTATPSSDLRVFVLNSGLPHVIIPPAVFFPLLFGAVDPHELLQGVSEPTRGLLTGLFPAGAPVYWRTDVV